MDFANQIPAPPRVDPHPAHRKYAPPRMPDHRATLSAHLKAHSLRTDGPFTLRSGVVAAWYMDARNTTFDGAGAWLVGSTVAPLIEPSVVAVGGLTMGADPVAMATALVATHSGRPLRAFSVRKSVKDHGAGGRLVGPVAQGDTVCLVEDTTTTGGAFFEALDASLEAGLLIAQAICLFDRSSGVVAGGMAERGIPYHAVFFPEDLGVQA